MQRGLLPRCFSFMLGSAFDDTKCYGRVCKTRLAEARYYGYSGLFADFFMAGNFAFLIEVQ